MVVAAIAAKLVGVTARLTGWSAAQD